MDAVDITTRLFPDLVPMSLAFSPKHHIKHCLPRTLWMCRTGDVLYEENKQFIHQMKEAGNDIRFLTYDGMEHGFFNYGRHENLFILKRQQKI
ncbi:alpha/beta hydrolase [Paenibacillus sp. An7]|uniref:alpha/beta hydrolase n=1 Tax=Paenibacillus sp. An7 TaxID=2689577 RepID=UPI002E2AB005|nr:alpha/beta hydrolase fold domain-containing protein [Paenibacillus sp. An7]